MDRFFYEVIAASDGAHHLTELEAIIASHPRLVESASPWAAVTGPAQADLYALLVVASDGLATDVIARERIAYASGRGFPVIPVVADRDTYDFGRAALAELADYNAEALNDPQRLVRSLLHHGGIELFEGGGHVFISYARADGSALADAVRDAMTAAGIGRTMDVHAFPGGDLIQDDIERRIQSADLVVLIDSAGAAKSRWVAEELDIAMAAHVYTIAVTPGTGAFHHAFQVPHVTWRPGTDAATEVLLAARRVLARRLAFRDRVARILSRLARLRDWSVTEHGHRWRVQQGRRRVLTVAFHPDMPRVEAVTALREAIEPGKGLLVAGVRPHRPLTEKGLRLAGGKFVRVTSLPTMASRIPEGLARRPLRGRRILLSAAMPSEPDDMMLARDTLARFVVSLTQAIVDLGGVMVFGGHPSVTPLVHRIVSVLQRKGAGEIELHQAEHWRGDAATLPLAVREGPLFRKALWHGDGQDASADVAALRDGMIRPGLDAGVFVGGRTSGSIGGRPGIIDEHERFVAACSARPAFVLGLARGAASSIPRDGSAVGELLRTTADSDLAVALILAELLGL